MPANYAKALPIDSQLNPYQTTIPNAVANQSWSSVFTVSSTVGLSDRTTVLQIMTIGAGVNFKWGPASVTATSFDGSVAPNSQQTFVVPVSIMAAGNSVMGSNGSNGLYNQISLKQVGGTGSVFAAEY